MINKFSYFEPKTTPKQLVVFLHGFGSNKDDLMSLSSEFASVLPEAVFVSPNAPHECEIAPDGYQWFDIPEEDMIKLGEFSMRSEDIERFNKDVKKTTTELDKFIDKALKEYNISAENLYLIGFSQGATMALHTATNRETPVKAVLSYSGIFFDEETTKTSPGIIGLAHGRLDDVVPFPWHDQTLKMLKKLNLNVKSLEIDNAYHEIPLEAIEFGKEILKESLNG